MRMTKEEMLKDLKTPTWFGEEEEYVAISYDYSKEKAYKKIRRHMITQGDFPADEVPGIEDLGVGYVRLGTEEDEKELGAYDEEIDYMLVQKETPYKVWILSVN